MTEFEKALIERLDAIVAEIKATREYQVALSDSRFKPGPYRHYDKYIKPVTGEDHHTIQHP